MISSRTIYPPMECRLPGIGDAPDVVFRLWVEPAKFSSQGPPHPISAGQPTVHMLVTPEPDPVGSGPHEVNVYWMNTGLLALFIWYEKVLVEWDGSLLRMMMDRLYAGPQVMWRASQPEPAGAVRLEFFRADGEPIFQPWFETVVRREDLEALARGAHRHAALLNIVLWWRASRSRGHNPPRLRRTIKGDYEPKGYWRLSEVAPIEELPS